MIAVIDVETTGLDARKCELLEIAVVVVDDQYEEVENGRFHRLIWHNADSVKGFIDGADKAVVKMHANSMLWTRVQEAGSIKPQVDHDLSQFLARFNQRMPIGGNSPALDQNFVREHLPLSYAKLDYHMRDVSSIAAFAQESFDIPRFPKQEAHQAMGDVEDCLAELHYYRDAIDRRAAVNPYPYVTLGDISKEILRMKADDVSEESIAYVVARAYGHS